MKKLFIPAFIIIFLTIAAGCRGKVSGKKDLKSAADTVTVPDTGFTGIKKYLSGNLLLKEVTFKNGIREGLTKTFDRGGRLYQTFWYENNLREDSACWYFQEGQVFRTTPYKHDTVDGIQKQYYRTGELRAKIGFKKGMRTRLFEEYDRNGKLYKGYPEIEVSVKDEYSTSGLYHVGLELSDKSAKVKFYRGEFAEGRYDTTLRKSINVVKGKATLVLKKSGQAKQDYISVIAEIVTPFGNRYLAAKKIELPYKDLN
jgi:hypothetical protein